jgi:hypothetical protein
MFHVDEVIFPAADTEAAYAYSQAFICLNVMSVELFDRGWVPKMHMFKCAMSINLFDRQ